jgi:hypothetical protein
MRFGSAGDNTRARGTSGGRPSSGLGLRSIRQGGDTVRGGSSSATVAGQIPSRLADSHTFPASRRTPFSSSRYTDGRSSVYRAPDRDAYRARPSDFLTFHDDRRPSPRRFGRYGHPYRQNAFGPVWYGPVAYPASSYLGFSWSNGSFGLGLSFASYSPACSTRYYDSWSCGGRGYSDVYYGGWRDNWYGGFSYVHNPWPVYRTCYLYEPEPAVETVYVTQPATATYVVESTEAAPVIQPPAPPPDDQNADAARLVQQPPTIPVSEVPQTQTVCEDTPAVERIGTAATSCFCPCHCNGQRPCTCDYPCGAEYAVVADQFNLSSGYTSYTEKLNPETIWASYAGFDREDSYTEPYLFDTTVSADTPLR